MNSEKSITLEEIEAKREELADKIYTVISQFTNENEDISVLRVDYKKGSVLPVDITFWVEDCVIKQVPPTGLQDEFS